MTTTEKTIITLKLAPRAMEILEGIAKIEGYSVEVFALKAISCYVSAYVESYDIDYLDELFGGGETVAKED